MLLTKLSREKVFRFSLEYITQLLHKKKVFFATYSPVYFYTQIHVLSFIIYYSLSIQNFYNGHFPSKNTGIAQFHYTSFSDDKKNFTCNHLKSVIKYRSC